MNLEKLNQHTIKVLERSGWNAHRKFDSTNWILALKDEGYLLHDYAQDILVELGNLSIQEKTSKDYMGVMLDFNPYEAASGEYDRLENFELICNDRLFPIGGLYDYVIYAGASKKIYLGDWEGVYFVGDSIESFLDNIFTKGYKPQKVFF